MADSHTILKKDRLGGGFDILSDQTENLWDTLKQNGAIEVGTQAQETERILQRKALWPSDSQRICFIHDLRLNEECCAFDKGCYVGQETINRMDVKGLVNKKLTLFVLSEAAIVGTTLHYNGSKAGIISSTCSFANQHYGLAIIRKKAWEQTLQYENGSATPITPS